MPPIAPDPLWPVTPEQTAATAIDHYRRWLASRGIVDASGYGELLDWSVTDIAGFWQSLVHYLEVDLGEEPGPPLADETMPGASWFPGARLNYLDFVWRRATRPEDAERVAMIDCTEPEPEPEPGPGTIAAGAAQVSTMTWGRLRHEVAAFATYLRSIGVESGDRVVGYVPHRSEAVIAFLAAAGIGATWAACGQDYVPRAAADRLGQLEPKVLIAADGYRTGGKRFDRSAEIGELRGLLPTVTHTVVIPALGTCPPAGDDVVTWDDALGTAHAADLEAFQPVRLPFDHPLWVVFSSGTTGKPKGIVHGHGGIVLEHLKQLVFHFDLTADDVFFWYTSPSWMMWNYQVSGLLVGATIVCYPGSPQYPRKGSLFHLCERLGVTVLGTSPAYLMACEKAGVDPAAEADLSRLRVIGVTGSVCPVATFHWVHDHVSSTAPIGSISGGTDIASAFMGWVPGAPVYAGGLSGACLGAAVEAWDEQGRPVVDEVGELVVTRPLPSMPVSFWNDPDGRRYRDSYFGVFPGVWRHGDWITVTERGQVFIQGRSDSTLNRHGIRLGTADIYQVVEAFPEVSESIVIGVEYDDGSYWMPLFVVLADGTDLDDELRSRIRAAIRAETSPRHVPDDIIQIAGVPHTKTGKRLEVPIKRIIQGADPQAVVDPQAVDDPDLLSVFAGLSRPR